MTVSSDPRGRAPSRRIPIPEVVGLPFDDAKIVLSNAGFERVSVHYTEDYVPDFQVVDQRPRPGLLVPQNVEVRLRICRQSFVQFMPQLFQQTALDGASFLKGFLYITQNIYDSVDRRLSRIHELFDPRTSDDEFLPWLASWLAISLNPDWSPLQRRKMLMAATQLFPVRGTAYAVREFVHIYVGANVVIEENAWPFQGFRIGVHSTVGDDTVILPPMNLAHCFVVRLDKPASQTPDDEIVKIHQIIQNQKPAHASYFLAFSDEAESGVMGSFMTIGVGGPEAEEGAPVFGIGIGADGAPLTTEGGDSTGLLYEEASEDEDEDEDEGDDEDGGKKKPKRRAKKPKAAAKPKTTAKSKRASKSTSTSKSKSKSKGGTSEKGKRKKTKKDES